jgi:dipeptidyl aminopeptidase/acylaminoacyl peptidase
VLDRRDVPTEFVLYPRSPHGPREPKQIMDIAPRILDRFDQHLGRASTE